jgi:hypothetical protein
MTTPLEPYFSDVDLRSSSAAILPVCGVESNKKHGGAGNTADAAVCASLDDCGTLP